MHFYSIKNIVTKIFFIMFFAALMLSLVGFRDIVGEIAKQGVKYKFKASIVEKVTGKEGKGLVVEKSPLPAAEWSREVKTIGFMSLLPVKPRSITRQMVLERNT